MKKKLITAILTGAISTAMCLSVFAGVWQQDAVGYWWQRDDGSYPAGGWEWIDDNGNGMAQCYYFDPDGYCVIDTVTPDGNIVDANGAWVVDGVVQMQTADIGTSTTTASSDSDYGNALPIPTGQVLHLKWEVTKSYEEFNEIYLNPDGTFSGVFEALRITRPYMGSYFNGTFSNIQKIDDNTYTMTLTELNERRLDDSPYYFMFDEGCTEEGLSVGLNYILYLPGAYLPNSYVLTNEDGYYCFIEQ